MTFQRNPFQLTTGGWLERAYRRYRFRAGYSRVSLARRPDPTQRRMVEELRRDGTLILEGYLPPDTVRVMQAELQHDLEALRFETPCLAQSRIDPDKHRVLIDNYVFGSNADFAAAPIANSTR